MTTQRHTALTNLLDSLNARLAEVMTIIRTESRTETLKIASQMAQRLREDIAAAEALREFFEPDGLSRAFFYAGVPTVVYGFFALLTVGPFLRDVALFLGYEDAVTQSALSAGLVMGVMIIPFVSSLADDVINAVPQSLRDGAYAMGATKSETVRQVIIPAALPGIVGAVLLAVSRAVGETMIVVMAAGQGANLTANPLESVTTITVQIITLLIGDSEFDNPKTGFGLNIVRLFVETYGGSIETDVDDVGALAVGGRPVGRVRGNLGPCGRRPGEHRGRDRTGTDTLEEGPATDAVASDCHRLHRDSEMFTLVESLNATGSRASTCCSVGLRAFEFWCSRVLRFWCEYRRERHRSAMNPPAQHHHLGPPQPRARHRRTALRGHGSPTSRVWAGATRGLRPRCRADGRR